MYMYICICVYIYMYIYIYIYIYNLTLFLIYYTCYATCMGFHAGLYNARKLSGHVKVKPSSISYLLANVLHVECNMLLSCIWSYHHMICFHFVYILLTSTVSSYN